MAKLNGYAMSVSQDFYLNTPKAVFAALAVSFATSGGDYIEEAEARLLEEWRILHQTGVVPQKPRAGK